MMPGILTEQMLALVPIDVFRYTNKENGLRIEGATFLNGAVVTLAGVASVQLLFIDDNTAQRWAYPDGFVYMRRADADNPPTIST